MKTRKDAVQQIGEVFLIVQKVERVLAAMLMFMSGDVEKQLQKLLLKDKQTLGRLMQHLNRIASVPSDAQEVLQRFLDSRNTFVHNLIMQSWFDIDSEAGRKEVNRFNRVLLDDARTILHFSVATVSKASYQPTLTKEQGQYIDRVTSRLIDTASLNFGGVTEDEYITKVLVDAKTRFP